MSASASVAPALLGCLIEVSVEGTVLLLLTQALAARLPSAPHRHALRALSLASLPLLVGASLLGGGLLATPLASLILLCWSLGAIAASVPLIRSLRALSCATAAASRGADGVLISSAVSVPLTWGAVRPVVLLPTSSADWSDRERHLAISHERAHIARGDWLVQQLTHLICLLLWFHPLVWRVRRDLLLDAELSADARVLSGGADPRQYARHLLDRFASLRAGVAATASGRPSQLGARVDSILTSHPASSPLRLVSAVALGSALLFILGQASPLPEPPVTFECLPQELP
ncbi:MAG: beta-lactamase regulating signal transducer with metallopeptidase domain [Myxococcota bacterium]